MTKWEPQKLQDWHLRVIDLLIADPTLTSEQISQELNGSVHPHMVAILRRTDMFKMSLQERRDAISAAVDANTIASIQGKLTKLAGVAVDTLTMQVERERMLDLANPTKQTTETCEMALRGLGIIKSGGGAAPVVNVQQNNVVTVDADILSAARNKMRDVHARDISAERPALPAPIAAGAGR